MSLQISVVEADSETLLESVAVDVCEKLKCQPGERCIIMDGQPTCDCIEVCELPKDERQKVSKQ